LSDQWVRVVPQHGATRKGGTTMLNPFRRKPSGQPGRRL